MMGQTLAHYRIIEKVGAGGMGVVYRARAQLLDAATDRHIWAKSYERDLRDVLALQGVRSIHPGAYEAYLKGRYYMTRRTEEGLMRRLDSSARSSSTRGIRRRTFGTRTSTSS